MWIERKARKDILEVVRSRPALLLTGIRQTGKSSILKRLFPDYTYVSLDDLLVADEAESNPTKFLGKIEKKAIIDEIQYAPSLFRDLKIEIDKKRDKNGRWILTGSQQLSLIKNASESLAGRISILNLFPLCSNELINADLLSDPQQLLWKGGFPEVWSKNLNSTQFFNDYIQTYLERDLKQVMDVRNLRDFRRFLILLAVRAGQLLNLTTISRNVGVSVNTIKSWVNVLETTGIIFLLPPYFDNLGKRVIKTPKLYFCDNGLLCSLLNIHDSSALGRAPLLGNIWENFVFTELVKNGFIPGRSLFFFRDQNSVEIDFVLQYSGMNILIESKYTERPKSTKLNFRKIQDRFDGQTRPMVACTIPHQDIMSLQDFEVFNPLYGLPSLGGK